jgi:two-component system LytT family response regulator
VAKALDKYKANLQNTSNNYEQLILDLQNSANKTSYKERFLVNKGDELVIVLTTDIAYFYKDTETYIVLKSGKRYPIKFSLEELTELLNLSEFHRINRQFIVSIHAIDKITLWFNGKLKLRLSPDFDGPVVVSREKAGSFKSWMDR